ncbi:zinc ribbon domain-containing protein, partial [Hydrocoleum sp. CS-953]|uniref:double zinc ribbon domain-containing protein n=1 Tax=Hydrocoleum sp. CS-953 TaxID=1671698 RepID=UPI001AEFE918
MLICPQCEFENPNNNKYCQKCGISLTHKNCSQCGSQVSLTVLKCHNCGADTGQVWKAIIVNQTPSFTARSDQTEINLQKLSPEEFITGGTPLAKDSAESAVDIITKESEEILESCLSSEEKIEIEDALSPGETVAKLASDIESENLLSKTIAETDNQIQDIGELAHPKSTTADILSPMSEAVNTENPLSLNDTEILSTASEEKYLDPQKRYQ